MQLNKNLFIITAVVLIRILAALYMFIDVVWGFLLGLLLDHIDAYFLRQKAAVSWKAYQVLDKLVDLFPYTVMLILSVNHEAFVLILVLFIYRIIGEFVFFVSKKQSYLIFFPNLFLTAFFGLVVLKKAGLKLDLSSPEHMAFLLFFFLLHIFVEVTLHHIWPKYLKAYGYPSFLKRLGYKQGVN